MAMLRDIAHRTLERMQAGGFEHAQVTVSATRMDEVNIADNEPSLLRTTDAHRVALVGIVDGRKAATDISDTRDDVIGASVEGLVAATRSAPRDDANRISSGQRTKIVQGPQESDVRLLTSKAAELLAFVQRDVPKVKMRLGIAAHSRTQTHVVTSGGSELEASVGHHALTAFGIAREGKKVSSLQLAGGHCHALDRPAAECFGIGEILRELEQQVDARPFESKFVGDVVLTPAAVADFVGWFLGQVCDEPLIAGTSLYRDRVGQVVGSPLLTLRSRFDAPGIAAISGDAFVASPVDVLDAGVLKTLTPSLYASLKMGLPHVPTAAGGWELAAGETAREALIAQVGKGALVGRLSMGRPAANGDFAGVIKNSFAIDAGRLGHALSETMISGNVARMLVDVLGVSRERLDTGAFLLPWVRIGGLHFS